MFSAERKGIQMRSTEKKYLIVALATILWWEKRKYSSLKNLPSVLGLEAYVGRQDIPPVCPRSSPVSTKLWKQPVTMLAHRTTESQNVRGWKGPLWVI